MAIELKVPSIGESITQVTIGEWLVQPGEAVNMDEPVVEIESEKATVELPAPKTGALTQILKQKGETALVGEVIGYLEEGNGAAAPKPAAAKAPAAKDTPTKEAPAKGAPVKEAGEARVMPAARRVMDEKGLSAGDVEATGPGGRILKEDALRATGDKQQAAKPSLAPETHPRPSPEVLRSGSPAPVGDREEEIVPMSPMRKTIAARLVEAQHNAAMLTTFNEVDMTEIMSLRSKFKDTFEKARGVKLGFMSFFVKACVDALKQFPQVNAEIRGENIVYKNFFDIGIAVGGGKGLVVPVLRNAERLSFGEIEQRIGDFGERAAKNRIGMDELKGGTFTITNGGVYGSLLSTPIINPPQSAVLGLHGIQERPVARDGQVVIRSMMYLALSYDHRIVDGRDAVTFLKRIKDCIEQPSRMLLEI